MRGFNLVCGWNLKDKNLHDIMYGRVKNIDKYYGDAARGTRGDYFVFHVGTKQGQSAYCLECDTPDALPSLPSSHFCLNHRNLSLPIRLEYTYMSYWNRVADMQLVHQLLLDNVECADVPERQVICQNAEPEDKKRQCCMIMYNTGDCVTLDPILNDSNQTEDFR